MWENGRVRAAWLLGLLTLAGAAWGQERVTIRMMGRSQGIPPPEATDPRSLARRAVFDEFHRLNPEIEVVNAGGLELTGDRAEAGLLMSLAGNTAPDVFYVNFRQYFSYIDQGFCRPLDDFLARDPGALDRVNPEILKVIKSADGKIYAAPFYQVAQALYYRKDHFAEAGLDPAKPPRTWDEFISVGRKLTEARPGRNGFVFAEGLGGKAYWWTNFVWQAGGEVLVPAERGYSKSAIDSPEAATALDFFRRLTVEKWTTKGKTYGPIASISAAFQKDITDGKISMWFAYSNDISLSISDLNPSLIGIAAMPAGPGGSKNEINAGMWAINSQVKDPKKLEACWKFIKYFVSQDAAKVSATRFVEQGMGNLVNPLLLREAGYPDIANTVDPGYIEANEKLFERGKPEPYGRNSQQVYVVLDSALDRARLEPDKPAREILHDVSKEMDAKLLGYIPEDVLNRQRGWATGILICLTVLFAVLGYLGIKKARRSLQTVEDRLPAGSDRKRVMRFMGFCIAPAGLSLLLWAYYPLANGLVIAFQDYRIVQGPQWVGLDNFIAVFTQPIFWKSLANSFIFVGLTLLVGFFLPILLALGLNEIPRFKVFFRTLFYLPAMTSPIVIAFLWRQLYDKSETGILNSLVGPLIGKANEVFHTTWPTALDWLGDPKLAMLSVVLPGVWAAAGPGSILYLAALKNVPDERYEAADLDGASWVKKIRFITMPSLGPLILINLLGSFIGGFKAMENVFVLTGGGPLYATHTIGLEIWTNAFMFLKFGYATAAAWVMGAILIGFTLIQLKNLTRMRFTAAKG
jgi:multiple sugar transport system permease protein